jgi:SAM-dependent methyltransferase
LHEKLYYPWTESDHENSNCSSDVLHAIIRCPNSNVRADKPLWIPGPVTPSDWAGSFFGPLYAELYSKHLLSAARSRREADFVRATLGLKSMKVLDLAAGYGRHARLLAKDNLVCALDLNLSYAAQALAEAPPRVRKNLACLGGDMRHLPFANGSMDAVLLLFNSFGYFTDGASSGDENSEAPRRQMWKLPQVFYEKGLVSEDFGVSKGGGVTKAAPQQETLPARKDTDPNLAVLQEIRRVLKPGGQMLIEVPNPKPLLNAVRSHPRRHVLTGNYEIEEEFAWDDSSRILSNRTRFRAGQRENDGEYRMRLYTAVELRAALKSCGLRPLKTYGSYDNEPYSSSYSEAILVHASKMR